MSNDDENDTLLIKEITFLPLIFGMYPGGPHVTVSLRILETWFLRITRSCICMHPTQCFHCSLLAYSAVIISYLFGS